MELLCNTFEFSEVPVRHNEDLMNACLARDCRYIVHDNLDSPHVKTLLLLQSHLSQLPMPCADYSIDLKLVLENIMRILQAAIEYSSIHGWLETCIRLCYIAQTLVQSQWIDDSPYQQIPTIERPSDLEMIQSVGGSFCEFVVNAKQNLRGTKSRLYDCGFEKEQVDEISNFVSKLPVVTIDFRVTDNYSNVVWNGDFGDDERPTTWNVLSDSTYCIHLCVCGLGDRHPKVIAPNYPRHKQDGWVILFGSAAFDGSAVSLRKFTISKRSNKLTIRFRTPEYEGKFFFVR